jgi:alpha-beta hydrolase superfamily lysophospholipase
VIRIYSEERHNTIRFACEGYRLKGVLHLPASENPPVVIGVHGLLSSSESAKQRELARFCTAAGMAYFRFDHRGCGRSQGFPPEVTSLGARVRDLMAAVHCIKSRRDIGKRIGIFGSSMGGSVCLAAARSIGADAMVTYAAPLMSRSIRGVDDGIGENAAPGILQRPFDISKHIEGLRNLLIFHGDADEVVPFSDALKIFDHAIEPKRLVRQPGGDHPMNHIPHQKRFTRITVQWFDSYLNR